MINEIVNILIGKKEFFLKLLIEHLEISLIAVVIAILIGLLLGIIISEFDKSSKWVLAVINFLYTIPSIALLGFLIPFSGVGNTTAIMALTVYALLPMVRNTYTGITNIDKSIIEASEGMGSTRIQILYKIKLPLAMPVIMSGIRSMVTMTIALAGIASFIGAGGLGVAIYRGITTNNSIMTMVGSLLIAFLAIVVDLILGVIEKVINSRAKSKRAKNRILISGIATLCILTISINTFISYRSDKNIIHIATKPMTEQYIIGEMLKELIEQDTNLNVELTEGVGGGTSNIEPAMENGEFDLYPEYTGTGWNMVLKENGIYDESLFEKLQSSYEDKLNFKWVGMYGFNNTYGLVVRQEIAEKYNIKTYSDLAKVSDNLIFGAEYDFFEREDGYDSLCKAYGMKFKNTMDMDIGLKYQAINEGKIDVMNIFTTDGQLSVSNVTVLEDDLKFYPSYMCGNVVRKDTLDMYPELENLLKKVDNILTDSVMADMNYQVETQGKDAKVVAHEFLVKAGLIK